MVMTPTTIGNDEQRVSDNKALCTSARHIHIALRNGDNNNGDENNKQQRQRSHR
jgi:hypothetical protein